MLQSVSHPPENTLMRPLLRPLLLLCLLCAQASPARAADQLEPALRSFLEKHRTTLPGQVSEEIGPYPRSEKLLACPQWQISLPAGSKPWGRISLAARCLGVPAQSLYVSVRIKVVGPILFAARHIPSGWTIEAADLRSIEGELSAQAPDVLGQPQEALGRTSRSSILAGKPLQRSLLRDNNIIQAGQPVRLRLESPNLSVSNEGIAIHGAARGQNVRVRLPGGKIVSGTAMEEGLVEIRP